MSADAPQEQVEKLLPGSHVEAAMTQAQKRFYESEECAEARHALQDLVDSEEYNTDSGYFSGDERGFVERHLYYLSHHPAINTEGYISNLKLMTRITDRK